jgi:hypothetical protein
MVQQLRIHYDSLFQCGAPWFRVRFRVVHGNFDLQMPKVWPPEALGKVSRIGERAALSTKPVSVPEPAGYYYKRFTLPLPRGVTVPGRLWVDRQGPSIGENLTITRIALVEDHNQPRSLDDFAEGGCGV